MKRILIILILAVGLLQAQEACAHRPDDKGRKEWFREMRQYKHDFLAKELNLTKEQQEKFFPIYDEMEGSIFRINKEARDMERKVCDAKGSASDLEYEKATEALYEIKGKEAAVEMQYLPKFKTILTPKQLFLLKGAEQKFMRELMKQHSRMKAEKRR